MRIEKVKQKLAKMPDFAAILFIDLKNKSGILASFE
jgi:hypothetical protein